ncbi:hypothetical protein [Chryseolinea lacunae]|uniref:PEP-CTERM sorting domain-containing protein n=1 Tax=Chryseolinea lacunae TaxID=2801331 RepID=A0ABS1KWV1_9BACT|nr:hypothetical protein [Chryseolinea lacunae]MBL0743854.1 hypothetical protein [Chryseolinea lacunae]
MKALLVCVCLILGNVLWVAAQPGNPASTPPVPITGLEYLLIGGGAYGVSRLLKNRNKADKD